MDNSQSTDVFSDLTLTNQSCTITASASNAMDMDTYEALINRTKASLCNDISAFFNTSLPDNFTLLLKDCHYCISQALKLLVEISESHSSTQKLLHYIEDAVNILNLLCSFIKRIIENFAMSCSTMKTFPTTTGQIIMDIFIHCRNSETIYSIHLTSIQQELKDLFRSCHELQLTYLMVLEKHFIFDLTQKEELDILVKALNINLHIGEVVQTLDVKTLAEQWKAYTMICEKYASHLVDTNICCECIKLLCSMVLNNMNTSLEVEQEEKLIVRSMKVAYFTIKILMRICNIFEQSSTKQYKCIVDMLINVYLYNPAYLETVGEKTEQFIDTISNNVLSPVNLLVNNLLNDESFVNVIINYNMGELTNNKEILGYIYLIITVMNSALEKHITIPRSKLLNRLFEILPNCYVWINIGMKFNIDAIRSRTTFQSAGSVGLFDYLLILATDLSLQMNNEEYCALETNITEALLGVDTVRALFASNLWTLLFTIIDNKQLLLSQLSFLCQTYQRLEKITLFSNSPQRVHLENTITSLFENVDDENRIKIYKHFNPLYNQNNISLWNILKIRNLPTDFQRVIEWDIVNKFKKEFRNMALACQNEKFIVLIKSMLLAATCSCRALEGSEDLLIEGWMRACPKRLGFVSDTLDIATVYFFEYVEALVSLTLTIIYIIKSTSSYLIKILHVILNFIMLKNTEFTLLLMDLFCKLAATPIYYENNTEVTKIINETFKYLIQDEFIRNNFFKVARAYDNKHLDMRISSIISCDESLLEVWRSFIKNERRPFDYTDLEEQLTSIGSYEYQHKCIEHRKTAKSVADDQTQNACSSNFDLADVDSLFDNESDGEPASKKVKFDSNKVDVILNRLEQDTILLCGIKENIFTDEHKRRIRLLNDKLTHVIT